MDPDPPTDGPPRLDLVANRPASQGSWRRAVHDTRRVAHSIQFIASESTATGLAGVAGALLIANRDASTATKLLVAGGAALVGLLAVLMLVLLWGLLRAPFRQRREARVDLERAYFDAHPAFPRHALKVDSLWYMDLDDTPVPGHTTRLIFVPIRFTNRESGRRVSLDCDLLWTRSVRQQNMGPYTMLAYSRKSIGDALPSSLPIEPETTVGGHLAFDAGVDIAFEYGNMLAVSTKDGFEVALRLTDHVTGASIEHLIESKRIVGPGEA